MGIILLLLSLFLRILFLVEIDSEDAASSRKKAIPHSNGCAPVHKGHVDIYQSCSQTHPLSNSLQYLRR